MAEIPREKSAADWVVDQFHYSDDFRESHKEKWESYYKLYRSYRQKSLYPLKSNIFVPYTFALVEQVVPKMLGAVFNTKPIVSVGVREGGDQDLAIILERMLDYLFDQEKLELYFRLQDFFKEAAIYGTSFAMIRPRFGEEKAEPFEYLDVDPIDLFNVFPDPRGLSLSRMKYLIIRSYVDYEDLEKKAELGIYKTTDVKQLKDKLASIKDIDEAKKKRLTSIGVLEEYAVDPDRKIIEILEYYDRDEIIVVGAREVLLKRVDNPYGILPFVMCKYTNAPHEIYGIGIPEMIASLQEELNTTRNQRMDNVNLVINRMWKASTIADIDYDNLISYPGNVIKCGDPNGLVPLETPDVTKSAYEEESIIKGDIELATSEYAPARGESTQPRQTATGIIRLQQAANARFDAVIKGIEFGTVRRLAKLFVWMSYIFLPETRLVQIVGLEDFVRLRGNRFKKMNPNDMLKCYDFIPMGSSTTAVKELRVQQIMQAYQMFNGDPYMNQEELRKMVLNALDIKNIADLLKTESVVQQEMQAAMTMGSPGEQGAPPPGGVPPGMAGDMMAQGATTGGEMGGPGAPPVEGGV